MKYRKKPVVIEAVKWDGNAHAMFDFLTNTKDQPIADKGEHFHIEYDNGGGELGSLIIHTLEGNHKANIGDYIIKGIKGEFYPCKPDIFEATYEPVDSESE